MTDPAPPDDGPPAAPPAPTGAAPAPAPANAAPAPASADSAPANAAPAPASAAPASAAPAAPTWTPPETFADRFSRWSVRAVRGAVAGLGLLSLVLFVLWAVPAVVVARSDAYRAACERLAGDGMLQRYVGAPITCARVPTWYRVGTPEGDFFRFDARGPGGDIQAEVRVTAGEAHVLSVYVGPRF